MERPSIPTKPRALKFIPTSKMVFQGEREKGGIGMCFNAESMARDGFFITTPPLILINGGAHPHILSMDFADKRTRSRTMAARSHLGAARSGRLLLAQQTARHEASAFSHRFKPRGHGRHGRRPAHALACLRHKCRRPRSDGGMVMTVWRNCICLPLNWTRHGGA